MTLEIKVPPRTAVNALGIGLITAALASTALSGCGSHSSPTLWRESALGQATASAFMLDQPAITVDVDGHPAVGYISQGSVNVTKWNGSAWIPVGGTVNAGGGPASHPVVALDTKAGSLVAAWEESASPGTVIRAARFDGSSWVQLGAQVNPANTPAYGPRIAFGIGGLVVAYFGGSPYTVATVAAWNGLSWQSWPQTPSQNAEEVELTLLPDGSPAVTWVRATSVSNGNAEIATRYWNAGAQTWMTLPSFYGQYPLSASLATDSDGSLMLAIGSSSPQPAQRAAPGSSNWESAGLPAGAASSGGPLASIPGVGVVLVYTGSGSWGIARFTASGWNEVATLSTPPSCLAGASSGALYVAWMGSPDQSLSAPVQVAAFTP